MTCPTCGGEARELPKREGRRERKQKRTQRDPVMLKIRAGMHLWECAACNRCWSTHDPE